MPFSRVRFILLFLVCVGLGAVPARAQRLFFQRGDVLYAATESGAESRPVLSFGTAEVVWAASPDGRRIAWMTRPAPGANTSATTTPVVKAVGVTGLGARPAVVRVSDVSGRHQKRLFATNTLRDRQGKPITAVAVYPNGTGNEPTEAGRLDDWEPVALSWSADSRTLYLSCLQVSPSGPKATFAVDGVAGAALIDGDGRWKAIAPLSFVAAQGGLLVGTGYARLSNAASDEGKYSPLVALNLFEGSRTVLYKPAPEVRELPPYAYASSPALAPGNRAIAFTADKQGLWLTDKFGKSFKRLAEGDIRRPRWSSDGLRVLFLLPRPLTGDQTVLDLYSVTAPADADALPGPPTLVLQNVDGFDILPD